MKKSWKDINIKDIQKSHALILEKYGTLNMVEWVKYSHIQNKYSNVWFKNVDSISLSDQQTASVTFLWYVDVHLKLKKEQPLRIVKTIVDHFFYDSEQT